MHTIDSLHHRALRVTGAAADRALIAGSTRLATLAEEAHELAQRAYHRQDAGLMARAIQAARAIGRRVRTVTSKRGEA